MTRQQFLDLITPAALKAEALYGVPATLCLAQAAIESRWGKKPIGNNYWGIKRAKRHTMFKTRKTYEVVDGDKVQIIAEFADYPSVEDGAADYAWLLSNAPVYRAAWEQFKRDGDINGFIERYALVYATDHAYAMLVKAVSGQANVQTAINNLRPKKEILET